MSLISGSIPNMIQGVSQQPPKERLASQAEDQQNSYSSVVDGVGKRSPTQHISQLSTNVNATNNPLVHFINRDDQERYVLLVQGTTPFVYGIDGTKYDVRSTLFELDYLDVDTPVSDLEALTLADTTFIVNKTMPVSMLPDLTPSSEFKALIWIKAGNYSTKYTAKVAGQEYTYTTPASSPANIATDYIAFTLYKLLKLSLDSQIWNVRHRDGDSIVWVERKDGQSFDIESQDSASNTQMSVVTNEVQRFTDLPPVAPNGMVVKVRGDFTSEADDYWVKFVTPNPITAFGPGVWEETVKGGIQYKLDPRTMPHILVRQQDPDSGEIYFQFQKAAWDYRLAGDDDTNPLPSFVGHTISNVFLHRNRLGLLSGTNVVMSESGNFFNFHRTSILSLRDGDPIDVSAAHPRVVKLTHAVGFNQELVLFGDSTQLVLSGGDLLTPSTVSIKATTEFGYDAGCDPLLSEDLVFFPFKSDQFSGMREYYASGSNSDRFESNIITGHVPRYIPGRIFKVAASSTESVMVALSDTERNSCFIYQWRFNGQDKVQSAWSKWTFNASFIDDVIVQGVEFIGPTLYLVIKRECGQYLEKLELNSRSDPFCNYVTHLDRRITDLQTKVTYDSFKDQTIFELPYKSAVVPTMVTRAVEDPAKKPAVIIPVVRMVDCDTPPTPIDIPDLPIVTIVATDPIASESDPGDTGTFTLFRTGSLASDLLVNLRYAGSATPDIDYTVSPTGSTVTFPAGQASVSIVVTAVDDDVVESDETVILSILPSTGSTYNVGNPGSATVTIIDDDQPNIPDTSVCAANTMGGSQFWSPNVRLVGDPDNGNFPLNGTYAAPPTGSEWISINSTGKDTVGGPGGVISFSTTVKVGNDVDLSTLTISGQAVGDNAGEIWVNGVNSGETTNDFDVVGPFTIPSTAAWQHGDNLVEFRISDGGGPTNYVGLAVAWDSGNDCLTAATPADPTALSVTGGTDTTNVLSWTDNSSDETGFKIERSGDGITGWSQIATVGANTTTFTDTGLAPDTTYFYRVRANAGAVNSGYTNVASRRTSMATSPPGAPSDLIATAVSSSQINLSWTSNSTNEAGFKIERSLDGTTGWTLVATVGPGVTTWSDKGLAQHSLRYYRVQAFNSFGLTAYTNIANAQTPDDIAPAPPDGLVATVAGSTQINLTWNDNSVRENGYFIERSAVSSTSGFAVIKTTAPNVAAYADIGLAPGVQYWYRVRAFNGAGNSSYTNVATATTTPALSLPGAPTGLKATAVSTSEIQLTWTDNSSNEVGFDVERSDDGVSGWINITTTGQNVTFFPNTGLPSGRTFYYRVRAKNGAGNSAYTNTASATTQGPGGSIDKTVTMFNTGEQKLQSTCGWVDKHWTVNGSSAFLHFNALSPVWADNSSASQWISYATTTAEIIEAVTTTRQFQTVVNIGSGVDLSTLTISGQMTMDDTVEDILVNGQSTGVSFTAASAWTAFHAFTLPATKFVHGPNTVTFMVKNVGVNALGNPTGLNVMWDKQLGSLPIAQPLTAAKGSLLQSFVSDPLAAAPDPCFCKHRLFVAGDKRDVPVWIGIPYAMKYQFSAPQLRKPGPQGGEVTINDGRLQLKTFSVEYADTGYFRAEVQPKYRDLRQHVFVGRKVGVPVTRIGEVPTSTGVFKFLTPGKNDEMSITLVNDSFLPSRFQAASFEADFTSRSRPT